MEHRTKVYESLPSLFTRTGDLSDEDLDAEPETKKEREKREADEKYKSTWAWYEMTLRAANQEFTKMDDVIKQPAIKVFNYISYDNARIAKKKQDDENRRRSKAVRG